jgi:hypothetical protein
LGASHLEIALPDFGAQAMSLLNEQSYLAVPGERHDPQ